MKKINPKERHFTQWDIPDIDQSGEQCPSVVAFEPCTLNSEPRALNPEPRTQNPEPRTLILEP